MHRLPLRIVLFLLLLAPQALACRQEAAEAPPREQAERPETPEASQSVPADSSAFGRLIARLSEPGGYFDTDNLISNETSYLHVLDPMREMGLQGGAYLGVGPDQNFSYVAQLRPSLAFMIDIRPDNLLQHLWFKALFALARNRVEYLSLLAGKPAPADLEAWAGRSIDDLVAYVEAAETLPDQGAAVRERVRAEAGACGVPLSEADLGTIDRIHRRFIEAGLNLRFNSHNRAPQPYYPTFRQLLLEKDLTGRPGNYLAREEDFQFLKTMQAENRIIPVIGDLAGPHAVAEIGRFLEEQGEAVTVFYTSNVEQYLMQDRSFDHFAENVKQLPAAENAVLIRSYFNRYRSSHPQTVPGYASTQLLQPIVEFVEAYDDGMYRSYWDLLNAAYVEY